MKKNFQKQVKPTLQINVTTGLEPGISSLRSRRYSRAQGGKLEIPPARKLSILSSAHRAHGSAHTNVFALENQSEREFLIMLLVGCNVAKDVNLIIVLYFSVMASKTTPGNLRQSIHGKYRAFSNSSRQNCYHIFTKQQMLD